MKTENLERIRTLLTELSDICEEEKEKYLSISIMKKHLSFNNSPKPKRKYFYIFSTDRGKTWSDLK